MRATFIPVVALALLGPSICVAEEFAEQIRPLLLSHCVDCHSSDVKKGDLNLERFANAEQVRGDIEVWESVLGMIQRGEMPPKDESQLSPQHKRSLVSWIRQLIDHEALARDGDPGPSLVRRLNNAEYDYAIRDLTGVDLQPARRFPADGAAGEGFLNATDALGISPDQMSKYYDAAKEVAAHAVLLPDGFRFSSAKFRGAWTEELLEDIRSLYAEYTNPFGQIPYDRYLTATIQHRDAIREGRAKISDIASQTQLSAKYLQAVWDAMNDAQPSMFLDEIRRRWRGSSVAQVGELADLVSQTQALLWHKRDPVGMHSLDDRYVPPGIMLTRRRNYKLAMPPPAADGTITFYIASSCFGKQSAQSKLLISDAVFEAKGKPNLTLHEVIKRSAPPPSAETWLTVERFDGDGFVMSTDEMIAVRVNGEIVPGTTLSLDAEMAPANPPGAFVHLEMRLQQSPPRVKRGVEWTDVAGALERYFLVARADDQARAKIHGDAAAFRDIFPARVCYPGVRVIDTVVTLERFHRGDAYLSQLLLSDEEHQRLHRAWEELHFVSRDALEVRDSFNTLIQGEMRGYNEVRKEVDRRAKETEDALRKSQALQIDKLIEFASRAYRRPLPKQEQATLGTLYESLRAANLPHEQAFRSVLARVLISPNFLYRPEESPDGQLPGPVNDWELATRLSFFLWSSIPDQQLRQLAMENRLHQPEILNQQVRRMLNSPRSRALAVEFGTQWLEVRDFDEFDGKNEAIFPSFDADLRKALYEESILFFEALFRRDGSIWELLDANYAFVNQPLAEFYGVPGVGGGEFRRVDDTQQYGRGGILGLGAVLAKHSGASRTSPVLRGNWIAEILLGERLPRPPDDVPRLPETESTDRLSIRELVEKHAELPNCAVCHQRIDPLGFALEHYDTIGRRREKDAAGREIDARAILPGGDSFTGLDGLKRYLLSDRREDFQRQFCRKLLGFALGRRVIISDRKLLERMVTALNENDGRISAAVNTIIESKQFTHRRND